MKTLYQQINLYQPIFRRQRQVFSAVAMAQAAAVVAVALLVTYAYGLWQVADLEAQALLLEGRERAFATQLASLDPTAGAARRREAEAELERLNAALLAQQRLIDVLEERPLGTTDGFSARLAALGRRHMDALWLSRLAIDGSSGAMSLAGRSARPELVPEYLQRLGEEQALAGQRFDRLEIERAATEPGVHFHVASRAVSEPHGGGERP